MVGGDVVDGEDDGSVEEWEDGNVLCKNEVFLTACIDV